MKRILTLSVLVIMAILSLAMVSNAYAGTWICTGTVKHDGVAVQGAIVKIYQQGCLSQTRTDTTDASGYFAVLTSLPAGTYEALITNAPHLNWVSFYYGGQGDPTDLGIIELYPNQASFQDCRD
jgi:hypothetical protein